MNRNRAIFRYRLGVGLLIFGVFTFLAMIPLAFVMWGTSWGVIVPPILFGSLAPIAVASGLGLLNYLTLRRNRAISAPTESK